MDNWALLFLDLECSSKEDIWLDYWISWHKKGCSLEFAFSSGRPPWIPRWLLGGISCMNFIVKPDLWVCSNVPACGYSCQTFLALIALYVLVNLSGGIYCVKSEDEWSVWCLGNIIFLVFVLKLNIHMLGTNP